MPPSPAPPPVITAEPRPAQPPGEKTPTPPPVARKLSTESKNVERSDFAPSAEPPAQLNEAKSLPSHASDDSLSLQKTPANPVSQPVSGTKPKVPPRPEATKKGKSSSAKPAVSPKPRTVPPPPFQKPPPLPKTDDEEEDEEEEYIEYKFSPRKVFLFTLCQVCQASLDQNYTFCSHCRMIAYCGQQHLAEDASQHKELCGAIQEIAKKRGGHVYNNAKILTHNDFRNLRVHTLNTCESMLKRPLQAYEKEILLFPRLCARPDCRNWKTEELIDCAKCHQVAFCKAKPDHLLPHHGYWCDKFCLYQKLVIRQRVVGRIEPPLPARIFTEPYKLNGNFGQAIKDLYKNKAALGDECLLVTLSQLATGPLTALNAVQICQMEIRETFVIHLIGAELQFEGDTLDKWEAFFLHLMPQIVELRVVFVGPELNSENLPVEILSRIRMCRMCRTTCRNVKFDFQCGKLYHDYANSSAFTKPNLICFFNPGLYRLTGFCGLDTWPDTIKAAAEQSCPILVTSYTELESPLDLAQLQKHGNGTNDRQMKVMQSPAVNPFSSQRPERNFVSDEIAPMIFKNFYHFIVQ